MSEDEEKKFDAPTMHALPDIGYCRRCCHLLIAPQFPSISSMQLSTPEDDDDGEEEERSYSCEERKRLQT